MQLMEGRMLCIFLAGSRVMEEIVTDRDITDQDIIAGVASAHSINEKVEHSFLSRLSSRSSRTDSTYSSMSSGRTSSSSIK